MLESFFFYLFAAGAVISGIGVVRARSAVYSVLFLVVTMVFTAALFLLLKAFLIAAIQILVYAGAILVLFLFIVMLTDLKPEMKPEIKRENGEWRMENGRKALAAAISACLFLQIVFVIRSIPSSLHSPLSILHSPFSTLHGTSEAIGAVLFSRFVLPFELTSLLILAAITSIVVLAKKSQ